MKTVMQLQIIFETFQRIFLWENNIITKKISHLIMLLTSMRTCNY